MDCSGGDEKCKRSFLNRRRQITYRDGADKGIIHGRVLLPIRCEDSEDDIPLQFIIFLILYILIFYFHFYN